MQTVCDSLQLTVICMLTATKYVSARSEFSILAFFEKSTTNIVESNTQNVNIIAHKDKNYLKILHFQIGAHTIHCISGQFLFMIGSS